MASLSVFLPFLSEAGVGGLYHGGYCEEDGESKDDPVNIMQYYQFSSIVFPIPVVSMFVATYFFVFFQNIQYYKMGRGEDGIRREDCPVDRAPFYPGKIKEQSKWVNFDQI